MNAVLLHYALPVFVDTDPETFQIDARKVEAAITDRTVAIMPVHLGGSVADLDAIPEVARKHNLPVVEDACQSHLAEWRDRKVGTWGSAGCFSFQNSKNLTSGEGGAILTNDGELADAVTGSRTTRAAGRDGRPLLLLGGRGANLRLTEFQGALLLSQMTRLEHQSRTREQNAKYLTTMLEEIPGISPAKMYEGCTRNAYHLYMFRIEGEALEGLPRAKFLKALSAEGIPASGGYSPLNKQSFLRDALASKGFKRLYPKEVLEGWEDRNQCPANDRLCEEAVWFTQTCSWATARTWSRSPRPSGISRPMRGAWPGRDASILARIGRGRMRRVLRNPSHLARTGARVAPQPSAVGCGGALDAGDFGFDSRHGF